MDDFLIKAENVLSELAQNYTPEGSVPKAVVHQWIHAIASNSDLFASKRGVKKSSIISILKKNGLYDDLESFQNEIFEKVNLETVKNPGFKFIDLFAGIGGIRLGFQNAGGLCVFSSEWDKYSQQTYFTNFGETPFGDIRTVDEKDIPDHNVLCAGFPCQPFSKAGVSAREALDQPHGFECKSQGTLFHEIVRIAKKKKPDVIFLENVANLTKHDGGNTFKVIKEIIENELKYSFNDMVINSESVVPQRRVRCYMVCFKNRSKFTFPVFAGPKIPLRKIIEEKVDKSYVISQKLWDGHIKRTQRNLDRGAGFTAFIADLDKPANTLVARYGKDGKECLVPTDTDTPRKLTERECAKLQGFPDEFLIPVSRTQAYRQFGNSVVVPVIEKIAEHIASNLVR